MPNILDHVSQTPVLEIDVWPRSATCKEWFAITRRIIQDTIADMNLDPRCGSRSDRSLHRCRAAVRGATMNGRVRSIVLQSISAKNYLKNGLQGGRMLNPLQRSQSQ